MIDTIKQKTKTVNREEGAPIVVRRMRWKAARAVMKAIGRAAAELKQNDQFGKDLAAAMSQSEGDLLAFGASCGSVVLSAAPVIINSSDSVVELLVTSTTDLDAAAFDDLDMHVAAEVISAAVELNFDEELKNSFGGLRRAAEALMPKAPTT